MLVANRSQSDHRADPEDGDYGNAGTGQPLSASASLRGKATGAAGHLVAVPELGNRGCRVVEVLKHRGLEAQVFG